MLTLKAIRKAKEHIAFCIKQNQYEQAHHAEAFLFVLFISHVTKHPHDELLQKKATLLLESNEPHYKEIPYTNT